MKKTTISIISEIPVSQDAEIKGKVEKKSGKRIGYNYIILKSLKESKKNDVVKCLYIKSLVDFGFCVIKEGTYGDSKDREGRDIKDRLQWQKELHKKLQDKVKMPKLLGSFEENGNYYLVLQRIKGKSLYKVCSERGMELRDGLQTGSKFGNSLLDYFLQILNILETLHENKVVHRDATATNFMVTPAGKVVVIDMELSYSLDQEYPSPPFQLGTYGYMSPEQEATQVPTIKEDIFSLGAILLEIWTGFLISARKLTNFLPEELDSKVRFFIRDERTADIVIQCLQQTPDDRPGLETIRSEIMQYKTDIKRKAQRRQSIIPSLSSDELLETIQKGVYSLATPLFTDSERGWFSENMNSKVSRDKNSIDKAWYASFNRGAAGIIYLAGKAKTVGLDVDIVSPYIQTGLSLIKEKYIDSNSKALAGLHFGADGIAVSLATAIQGNLIDPVAEYLEWIDLLLDKPSNTLTNIKGISGQGLANFNCTPFVSQQKMQARLMDYVTQVLENQHTNGSWLEGLSLKKKGINPAFASGMTGIIYFLLMYSQKINQKPSLSRALDGLSLLKKKMVHRKGKSALLSQHKKEVTPWLYEGYAGIAMTFMKAYQCTGDPVYGKYAVSILHNINENILDNNLSQYRGLSGLGEVYLTAYEVFKDEQWLTRSTWIAQVLMQLRRSHPKHGAYWLVGGEQVPTANFMHGNSGVLHFLLRYLFKGKIGFPLLPWAIAGVLWKEIFHFM